MKKNIKRVAAAPFIMMLKDANEPNALQLRSAFKRLTTYFRNFFKDKYLYFKELKQQKLLKEIEKEFEEIGIVGKKKLAQSIQKTIDHYQKIVSSPPEPPLKPQTQKRVLQQQAAYRADTKVLNSLALDASSEYKPSQHEIDAFRMKAISLMKKNGMLSETISEVLKSPIHVNVEENNLMIKFSQRFVRLGEEFELQGMFLKKPSHSIPVSDSFQISRSKS